MNVDLRLGDCLTILPTLEPQSIDAIITDLPYGTTACSWDEVILFAPMWEQVKRVLKPRGAFVTTASQPFTSKLVMSNPDWFKYEWVWRKTRPSDHVSAKLKPMKDHENVLVFSPGTIANGSDELMRYYPQGLVYAPQVERRPGRKVSAINGDRPCLKTEYARDFENYPRSVIEFANPNQGNSHPTQKPVALYAYLIRTYTNAGDTVMDFVMGSGTTGVAAVKEGRSFVGVEQDERYFAIAQRRIAEAQLQLPLPLLEATP